MADFLCIFVWYLDVYIAIYISYNTELKNKKSPERGK